MTPVHQQYTSEIHAALNHYAAWDPGTPLTLGTVGTFSGRHFVPQDHLDNLKIRYKVRKDETLSKFEYHTQGAELRLKGNVLAKSLDLAKISTNATVAGSTAMTTKIVGASGTTPLFRVSGIQQNFLDWLMEKPPVVGVYYGPHGASTEVVSATAPAVLEVVP